MDKRAINRLTRAFHTEVAGYSLYLTAIDKVEDEKARAMFHHIAQDELEHIRVLTTITDSLKASGKWLSYEEALFIGASIGEKGLPIFPKENELIKRLGKNPGELDVLNVAIEVEEKAIALYTRDLGKAKEVDTKLLLSKLLDMERGHLNLLRWEYEALVRTGFWCDIMEFTVEGEKEQ